MRNYSRKFLALALFAVALSGAAVAQDITHTVRANIPFDFYAGGKLMPAGEYTVSISREQQVATLGQRDTGHSSFLSGFVDDDSRNPSNVLVFQLAGDTYALSELKGPEGSMSFKVKAPQLLAAHQSQKGESVNVNAEAK